jgi:hypothetical protein
MTNDKVIVQIDGEIVELKGEEKETFLINKQKSLDDLANVEAAKKAKLEAKTAAQAKLAALGLTVEDLQALGL